MEPRRRCFEVYARCVCVCFCLRPAGLVANNKNTCLQAPQVVCSTTFSSAYSIADVRDGTHTPHDDDDDGISFA